MTRKEKLIKELKLAWAELGALEYDLMVITKGGWIDDGTPSNMMIGKKISNILSRKESIFKQAKELKVEIDRLNESPAKPMLGDLIPDHYGGG